MRELTLCPTIQIYMTLNTGCSKLINNLLNIIHIGEPQQVKWSGRVTEGAGLSTGETTELANSYMSRLGQVVRNKEPSGR